MSLKLKRGQVVEFQRGNGPWILGVYVKGYRKPRAWRNYHDVQPTDEIYVDIITGDDVTGGRPFARRISVCIVPTHRIREVV